MADKESSFLTFFFQAGCEDDVVTVCQRAINHQNIEDQDVTITMSLLAIDRDSAISVMKPP